MNPHDKGRGTESDHSMTAGSLLLPRGWTGREERKEEDETEEDDLETVVAKDLQLIPSCSEERVEALRNTEEALDARAGCISSSAQGDEL